MPRLTERSFFGLLAAACTDKTIRVIPLLLARLPVTSTHQTESFCKLLWKNSIRLFFGRVKSRPISDSSATKVGAAEIPKP